MKKSRPYLLTTVLGAFGLLTLFLSTSVIFDLFGVRAREGNYVLFIVWANFVCSWLYLTAAYGFAKSNKWTVRILSASVLILTIAFVGLIFHINNGGIYETKTIGAMIFRIAVTLAFTAIAYFSLSGKYKISN